jgi:hypothetical protein
MRHIVGAFLMISVAVAAAICPTVAPAFAKIATKTVKLEGMGYLEARKVILSSGWKPVVGGCQVDAEACERYPELETCSCCGSAPCGMLFAKQGRCLGVVTLGGPPQAEEADAHVDGVRFWRGKCSKNTE